MWGSYPVILIRFPLFIPSVYREMWSWTRVRGVFSGPYATNRRVGFFPVSRSRRITSRGNC